ncbi:MAG: riboflavin synthase [Candidatus Kapabacteria bacterium]|nr:riboflavin synthase [Candidatus Kapabacteria bacterium]
MFTGLIEEKGTVISVNKGVDGSRLTIRAKLVMEELAVDHSISVNGVCLTVVEHTSDSFTCDVVAETLRKTTTGLLEEGADVNLERAVRMSDRLGGHLVQGHIDTTGIVQDITKQNTGWEMWISFPQEFRKWLIPVGSVCVNGISLTVAELQDSAFKIAIIPHTLAVTTLSELRTGNLVNLEFDVLAKYVENITTYRTS